MVSVFSWTRQLGPAGVVVQAIFGSLVGIGLLLAFILGRRAVRRRYFRRYNARSFAIHKEWDGIVSGAIPLESWRMNRLDCEIIETMLLDDAEMASGTEAERLVDCLRSSGLLAMRIHEARNLRGWRRQRALVTLGRSRVPEAIPALSEALEDPNLETRVAAVRGLGRTGLPVAALRILDWVLEAGLRVPAPVLQNALLHCCGDRPQVVLPYLMKTEGETRELLARVVGELATPELEAELLLLAADPLPEVRASAARALAEARPELAMPILSHMTGDAEWFVRLRAVVGLGALENPRVIPALIDALCDPNRFVRLRAAAALARLDSHLEIILEAVVETHDHYALQALISELERSGKLLNLTNALEDLAQRETARAGLLEALRADSPPMPAVGKSRRKPEEVIR